MNTQALATFYEPIYQSGVKVSYDFSDKVYGSLYLLNGYNVLADNNLNKSFGLQLGVKPVSNLEIIFNNITGNEQPQGSPGKTRFYNNLVVKYSPIKKLDFLLGADDVVHVQTLGAEPRHSRRHRQARRTPHRLLEPHGRAPEHERERRPAHHLERCEVGEARLLEQRQVDGTQMRTAGTPPTPVPGTITQVVPA